MKRRDFIKLLGLAAAQLAAPAVLQPDKKLWQLDRTMVPAQMGIDWGLSGGDAYVQDWINLGDGKWVRGLSHTDRIDGEMGYDILLLRDEPFPIARIIKEYDEKILRDLIEQIKLTEREGIVFPLSYSSGVDVRILRKGLDKTSQA